MAQPQTSPRRHEHPLLPPPPAFEILPVDPKGPAGNQWGRFGPNDQLGMLNLLTPDVVAAAAQEIRTGVRISLDWSMTKPLVPSFGRPPLQHHIKHKPTPEMPHRPVNDDLLTLNTQSSTQWDGFRHYGHLASGRFYNDTSLEQIHDPSCTTLGIDQVADAGGIVGRGVLVDLATWADRQGITLTPFESRNIPLQHLLDAAEAQSLQFRPADILFVRSGFTRAYEMQSQDAQRALAARPLPEFAGVEASEATIRWLWDMQFAAVAGDAPAFERCPWQPDQPIILHDWLLPRWGMPIGEMFDLEKLAEECSKQQRYTFFLSSVPLKVPGGVASPPNAIAIF